jgi:hypothetical protein
MLGRRMAGSCDFVKKSGKGESVWFQERFVGGCTVE